MLTLSTYTHIHSHVCTHTHTFPQLTLHTHPPTHTPHPPSPFRTHIHSWVYGSTSNSLMLSSTMKVKWVASIRQAGMESSAKKQRSYWINMLSSLAWVKHTRQQCEHNVHVQLLYCSGHKVASSVCDMRIEVFLWVFAIKCSGDTHTQTHTHTHSHLSILVKYHRMFAVKMSTLSGLIKKIVSLTSKIQALQVKSTAVESRISWVHYLHVIVITQAQVPHDRYWHCLNQSVAV